MQAIHISQNVYYWQVISSCYSERYIMKKDDQNIRNLLMRQGVITQFSKPAKRADSRNEAIAARRAEMNRK